MRRAHRLIVPTALTISIISGTAAAAGAQTRPAPAFVPPPDGIEAIAVLLESASARDQAWGAWYAGRDQLTQFAPQLRQIAARHIFPVTGEQFAAADIALDALIQMHQRVPGSLLRDIHGRRPEQALILAGFNDNDQDPETDEYLLGVMSAPKPNRDQWYAAANLLLQRKTFGLARAVMSGLRLSVRVTIVDTDDQVGWVTSSGGGVGVGCGAPGRAEGLPPWAAYHLAAAAMPGAVVHSTGPVPMYYQRWLSRAGDGPMLSGVDPRDPSAYDRLLYLARLAAITEENLPVRAFEFKTVRWSDADHLQKSLEEIRADVLRRWGTLAELMVRNSALDAGAVATELPAVDLTLHDARKSRTAPLSKH